MGLLSRSGFPPWRPFGSESDPSSVTQGTTGARASAAAYPILTLTTLLWAGNTVAGKWAVGEVSPQVLTTLRWAFAFAVLLVVARRQVLADRDRLVQRWPYLFLIDRKSVV